ncbi:hypothetical protein EBZ39_19595 [bacterium]|nr:hypothetical protein [bacterium]
MKTMTFKAANIQQATPAKRGSRAGDDASDLASLSLHSGEHGFDCGRDGNAEGFASSTLGAGERKDTILQVDAIKGNLRLSQSAPRGQGNLEANSHPFGHTVDGQGFPGDFNLIIRKDGFNAGDRPPLNSVIQKGDRIHLTQQSALAVNPFKNFQILAGLVPARLAAGGAWEALTPSQINFTIGCGKRLQSYFFLTNKTSKMTPAIQVVGFCERGNGMIFDQILNPIVATIRSLFINANSSSLGRCLCAMQRIVDSVARALATPFSSRVFKTNKEPRAAAFLVRIRHGDNGNIYSI